MCHSLPTQRKYYRLNKSRESAVQAFSLVQSLPPSTSTATQSTTPKKRRPWDEKDSALVEEVFHQHIVTKSTPSIEECELFLAKFNMQGRSTKNLQDKVRTFIRKQ